VATNAGRVICFVNWSSDLLAAVIADVVGPDITARIPFMRIS
jgi:hypothetical protein